MSAEEAEAFKVFEAEGWSAQAGTYGGLIGAITSRLADALLDAAGVRSGWRVLDVATGPGYVAERAAARGARVVGVDLAEGMLALPVGGPDRYRFADEGEFRALLEGADLVGVAVRTVELSHRVAGMEELWRGLLGSSVRTATVLRGLDAVARRCTRAALERTVEPYRTSDGALELPVAAKLASGSKR